MSEEEGSVHGGTKTRGKSARTFRSAAEWPEFRQGAIAVRSQLNRRLTILAEDLPCRLNIASPHAEHEVHTACSQQLTSVSLVSRRLFGNVIAGAGQGTASSLADLVVRETVAAAPGIACATQVSAVIEIKGKWQLSIQRDDRIRDTIRDEGKMKAITPALQQVA